MQIVERRAFSGPNPYSSLPILRMTLDLGRADGDVCPSFSERLRRMLPELDLRGPSGMGRIFERTIVALQQRAGSAVRFGHTRGSGVRGQYFVACEYKDLKLARDASELGLRLLRTLLHEPDASFDLGSEVAKLARRGTSGQARS